MEDNREAAALPAARTAAIDTNNDVVAAEQAVGVDGGLLVYSHDGQLIGRVGEFVIDVSGNLTSFVVHAGTQVWQDLKVPMTWIHTVTRDQILLRLTAAEVQTAAVTSRRAGR